MKWQIYLWVFYSFFAMCLNAADAGPRRASLSEQSPGNGFFFRLYLPSLVNQDGVPNDFYIYKVIPTINAKFISQVFNYDSSQFVPFRFLNKADFISFFNPKKPNKAIFHIVMGTDSVVLGRNADISLLKALVQEPYFEGEIRVRKNGQIQLKASAEKPLNLDYLKKAQEMAVSFFDGFGFAIEVMQIAIWEN